ncbi:MAG TPA: magnesium transporter CorA family protein [Methanolinea sp.]|nr:magnesium transporter CorA family protein [Methanolinea sp.]HQK55986.1 magnesium transporter CorA family protein [Methanolinea sp.]
MITIYKGGTDGLERIDNYESGAWINVVNPTPKEIEELVSWFNIPSDFLTDPLDVDERARIEREEGCVLILLRSPKREPPEADIPFTTLPIGIIFTQNLLITVSLNESDVIREFVTGKVKHFSTDQQSRFVLLLFMRSTLAFIRYLKEINRMTTSVERALYKALKNEQLIRLLMLEKSLVFFVTSLRSNALMMEKFNTSSCMKMSEDDRDLFEELTIENKQAIEMANIYSSILSDMMDAFASVISNNLNVVMKLLTTVTIILMIPTLVASIYGMNVELPYQHTPYAFLVTVIISLALSAVGIIIFWRKEFF